MTPAPRAKLTLAAWLLAGIAVAARVVCIVYWPGHWYGIDLRNWQVIAGALLVGINPYQGNALLNWPPMWMEVLFAVGHICDRLDWPFMTCLRLLLTAADAALILSACALARALSPTKKIFAPIMWGLCLNPLLILLTIQQGNFDVIPTTLILWFLISLINFRRRSERVDWLIAAGWLGLGAFAKTFPLILVPLLIAEARRVDVKTRLLGALLCLGPAAISLAPLFSLGPHDVLSGVILYRGTPGPIGAAGLILLVAGRSTLLAYAPVFTATLLPAMVALSIGLWRRPLRRDADLVFFAAILLLAVIIFGSGNSVQYWYWIAPLLAVAYVEYARPLRAVIVAATIIIVATELVVFAYNDQLGCIACKINPAGINHARHDWLAIDANMSLFSLPATAVSLLLWIFAVRSIVAPAKNPPRQQ